MSVSDYLDHHNLSWLELQRTSPRLLSYEDQTIFSTWNLSYIHIRNEDQSAAKLLELWACLDNQDLWYELLKAGENDSAPAWFVNTVRTKLNFQSAMSKLQKHALIERLSESDGYSMHHCVHSWLKNVLCKAVETENIRLALYCASISFPFYPEPGDWTIKQRLVPHFDRCLQLLRVWDDEKKMPEEIQESVANFHDSLGSLYREQGRLSEAESMYNRALDGLEKTFGLGKNHRSILLSTVNNLANLYSDKGKFTEAESMYDRALTGYEETHEQNHRHTLAVVQNLAMIYHSQGKLTEAESMYERALTGQERTLGRDHANTLSTVNNLGCL